MTLKFLFGQTRLIAINKEDIPDNHELKDAILLAYKTDILQHSDMRNRTRFLGVTNGGFVKCIRDRMRTIWFGESVSCRVSTDESMGKVYHKLVEANNYYQYDFELYGKKHAIFMVCPEGYYPSAYGTSIEWLAVDHNDLLDVVHAEEESNY